MAWEERIKGQAEAGTLPVVPKIEAAPEMLPPANGWSARVQQKVTENPTVLDDDGPVRPPPPTFTQISETAFKFDEPPEEGVVEKFFKRGASEVTQMVGSIPKELPKLFRNIGASLSEMPDPLVQQLRPDLSEGVKGSSPSRTIPLDYEAPLREVGEGIQSRSPMTREQKAAFDAEHPVLGTVASASAQLGTLYLLPTAGLKAASALTMGVEEQIDDAKQVESETGVPLDAQAQATAEMLGAAFGATDLLPYAHAMRGLFRTMPHGVRKDFALKMEKWWRAQSVGARYASETISTSVFEGLQEAFQRWGTNMTARDWVGYDPDRDPTDTLAENMQGGMGAGVVFDALIKMKNKRGFKTLRAEDRQFELGQDVERKKGEAAELKRKLGEAPTRSSEVSALNAEKGRVRAMEIEKELSTETAKLGDLPVLPQPQPEVFERQASRATEFFEQLPEVTVSDLNRFLAMGVSPGEAAIASELFNKLGSGVSGQKFVTALQGQLFPLVGRETTPGANDLAGSGFSFAGLNPSTAVAVSWESPFVMTGQDIGATGRGLPAASHTFVDRREDPVTGQTAPATQQNFEAALTRATFTRIAHLRYGTSADGVPLIVEVQTDRIPMRGSPLGEVQRTFPQGLPDKTASASQQQLLKGEVNQRGLRYVLRNQMAKFSSRGIRTFRILTANAASNYHGLSGKPILKKSYEQLEEWLRKNFQVKDISGQTALERIRQVAGGLGFEVRDDGFRPGGGIKFVDITTGQEVPVAQLPQELKTAYHSEDTPGYLQVEIPENFHQSEIPFGADLGRPLRQVETPYTVHEAAVENMIQTVLKGNVRESQVFKVDQLKRQAQRLRQALRVNEKALRQAKRYENMTQQIKDLEQDIRSREAGARRLQNILNWGARGKPPGTPGFYEGSGGSFDRLDKDAIHWGLENFGTLMDLAYRNKHIKPLQDLARHVWFKHADMMRQVHKSIETVKVLDRLSRKQRDIVFSQMIQNVTDSKEVGQRMSKPDIVKNLRAAGAKDKTIEAYMQVRQDFEEAVNTLRGALLRNVKINMLREGKWRGDLETGEPVTETAGQELNRRSFEIDEKLASWGTTEYFPFLRFGDHKVRVTAKGDVRKDGQLFTFDETVEHLHFPTQAEADDAVKELNNIYKGQPVSIEKGLQVRSPFAVSTGVPEGFMAQLTQGLNLSDEQKHLLFEMAAKTAPSKTFIQRYLKKKMVSGYSQDGIRAYADYFYSFASYISNLKYDHLIDQYRAELRASTEPFKGARNVDTTKRDRIVRYVEYHVDRLRANQNEFATLRQIGTFWFLGFVAKTAFVNALQVPMILWPHLSVKYGRSDLTSAYGGQVGEAILSTIKRFRKVNGRQEITPNDGLNDVLGFLYESGKLNQSFLTELAAATSEDRIKAVSAGRLRRYWHEGVSLAMKPFQLVEELNRRVAAEATYRLEMEVNYAGKQWSSLTPEQRRSVREAVVETLDKTMFDYSRWNRAKFQQGIKSPIFLFYGYTQGLLSFLGNDPGRGRAFLILLLVGGLEGLPFFGNLLDVLDSLLARAPHKFRELFGDLAEGAGVSPMTASTPDLRGMMRDFVMRMSNGDVAVRDLVMNGVSKRYGLGPLHMLKAFDVNVPEIDVSGSLSVGRIIPGTDKLRQAVIARDGRDAWEGVMESIAGPLGSAASGQMQAMLSNDIDTWKQLEKALPVAGQHLSKGIRQQVRGGETENITDVTIPTTTGENIAQGLGFRPTSVAKVKAQQWQLSEKKLWFAGQRKSIFDAIERHIRTVDTNDPGAVELPEELQKQLEYFNRVAPGSYKIGRESIRRSMKDRFKSGATESAIGVENVSDLELWRELERLVGPGAPPTE